MQNLIKEIEKQKINRFKSFEEDAWNNALDKAIRIINQYNLITAPKSIKLSEVVSRLKDAFKDLCNITYRDLRVINRGFIYLEDEIVVTIDKEKNIILNIEFTNTFIVLKWLYALWIAGSEIIDDLEEKEHEED